MKNATRKKLGLEYERAMFNGISNISLLQRTSWRWWIWKVWAKCFFLKISRKLSTFDLNFDARLLSITYWTLLSTFSNLIYFNFFFKMLSKVFAANSLWMNAVSLKCCEWVIPQARNHVVNFGFFSNFFNFI